MQQQTHECRLELGFDHEKPIPPSLTSVLLSLLTNGLLDTSAFKYNHNNAEFFGWRDLSNEDLVDEGPNEFIEPVDYYYPHRIHDLSFTTKAVQLLENGDNDLDQVVVNLGYKLNIILCTKGWETPSLLQQTSVKVSIASSNGPIGFLTKTNNVCIRSTYPLFALTSGRDDIFRHRRYPKLLSRFFSLLV